MTARRDIQRQYGTTDPLLTRMETHQRYEERRVDLDAVCRAALRLAGDETVLDIGCGPGSFLLALRRAGHAGMLIGLDQSAAMLDAGLATARAEELPADWLRGDARALPVATDTAERVVARHMLYHVPHIPRALRECARVLRPNGVLLTTTNARHSLPRIDVLLDDLARAFALPAPPAIAAPFCVENAPEILGAAGFDATELVIHNALMFETPEPIVRYAATLLPSLETSNNPALRAEMERWLMAQAMQRLRQCGVWRDPKDVGVYVARVAPK